jgi:putative oxidoreductase
MVVAMISVHWKNGFFAMSNGIEMPFLYAAAALGLIFTGGGAISMDASLRLNSLADPRVVIALVVLSLVGAAATLSLRHGRATVPSKS